MSKNEKLVGRICKECGHLIHHSNVSCPNCKNNTFNKIEAKGNCKLLKYTIVNAPPTDIRLKRSYALGVVEFENGVRAHGQITPKENLKVGMKLKPVYGRVSHDYNRLDVYEYSYKHVCP